jgi:hypothetical protein
MTLKQCIEALRSFQALSQQKLPFAASFVIAQNMQKLKDVVAPFEEHRDQYVKDIRSQAYENEQGELVLADEVAEQFKTDIEILLNEDQNVKLKKVELHGLDGLDIEPQALIGCIEFLTLKTDANKGK